MNVGARNHEGASLQVRISLALPKRLRERTREITKVHTAEQFQRQGYATELMKAVCEEADRDGITLILWPKPYGDDIALSQAMLMRWYERFGFVVIQPEPVLMARMPWSTPVHLKPLAAAAFAEVWHG